MASKKKGCLIAAAIFCGCILVVVCVAVGSLVAYGRKVRNEVTDTTPLEVPVAQPTETEKRKLGREYKKMADSFKAGASEEFSFSADDLNGMIASVPDCEAAKGRVHFKIEDDRIKATMSIPLVELPFLSGRYINGEFDLKVTFENNRLDIYPHEIKVRGKPIPATLMNALREKNFGEELNRNPELQKALKQVEYVGIENNRLVIRSRAGK
ncbi:MAG: hypothetical protein KAI66_06005 [Lentisphaeria bacterium]|nr:hypothetical protein [Lentisphaeria bacterium]